MIVIPISAGYGICLQAGSKLTTNGVPMLSNVETSLEINAVFPAPAIPSTIIQGIFLLASLVEEVVEVAFVSSILFRIILEIFIKIIEFTNIVSHAIDHSSSMSNQSADKTNTSCIHITGNTSQYEKKSLELMDVRDENLENINLYTMT